MTLDFIGDPDAIACVGDSCVLPAATAQPPHGSDAVEGEEQGHD